MAVLAGDQHLGHLVAEQVDVLVDQPARLDAHVEVLAALRAGVHRLHPQAVEVPDDWPVVPVGARVADLEPHGSGVPVERLVDQRVGVGVLRPRDRAHAQRVERPQRRERRGVQRLHGRRA